MQSQNETAHVMIDGDSSSSPASSHSKNVVTLECFAQDKIGAGSTTNFFDEHRSDRLISSANEDTSSDTFDNDQDRDDKSQDHETNEKLLTTALISFMSFTVIQTIAAYIAHSEAMMGDSTAMCVDALSYAINLVAEREKKNINRTESGIHSIPVTLDKVTSSQRVKQARKRKIILELVPPVLSISVLTLVTIITTKKAVSTLSKGQSLPRTTSPPNTLIMAVFSSLNLLLDLFNLLFFMRFESTPASCGSFMVSEENCCADSIDDESNEASVDIPQKPLVKLEKNLNMCSAYTHIMADTIRSVAVLIAAAVAGLTSDISPERADAIAAIVVAAIILISIFPLIKGLQEKYIQLRDMDYKYMEIGQNFESTKLIF